MAESGMWTPTRTWLPTVRSGGSGCGSLDHWLVSSGTQGSGTGETPLQLLVALLSPSFGTRHDLGGTSCWLAAKPPAAEHWRREGLSPEFLEQFWRRLWDSQQPRRTMVFQWLVAHRGIAVGTWLQFGGRPPDCTGCGYFQETLRRCLWGCPLAQQVWERLLRLVRAEWFTWGSIAWSTLSGQPLGMSRWGTVLLVVADIKAWSGLRPPTSLPVSVRRIVT